MLCFGRGAKAAKPVQKTYGSSSEAAVHASVKAKKLPVLLGSKTVEQNGCEGAKANATAVFPTSALLPAAALKRDFEEAGACGATPLPSRTPAAAAARRTVRRRQLILQHGEEAQQLEDVYDLEDGALGIGSFGTVRKARLRSAPSVIRAVKVVPKRTLKAERFVRQEIAILRRLDHPRICRLVETFEDDQAIYLVLEYIEGRELFDEIVAEKQLGEHRAAAIMQQVLGALAYCHERKVLHRDLKPENIMVVYPSKGAVKGDSPNVPGALPASPQAPEVKLIDFGLAVFGAQTQGRAGSSVAGTAEYLAPEARRGRYFSASDIWSMGMILHALLLGDLPSTEALLGEEFIDYSGQQYAAISTEARDLLSKLIRPDPAKRLTAAQAAAHPWIQGRGVVSPTKDFAPTVAALTSFHRSVRLRRAALTAVAMQLTGQQLEELREQFLLIDTDGNGRISKEELVRSLELTSGVEATNAWVDAIFDAVDTDGSQEIEYTEWLAAAAHESAYRSDQAARAAFRCFDLDGDGCIDAAELSRVLAQTPEEIAMLMPQFDSNGDGVIDFAEFRDVLSGSPIFI